MKRQLLLSIRAQNPADPNTCLNEALLTLTGRGQLSHHHWPSIHTCSHMQISMTIKSTIGLWVCGPDHDWCKTVMPKHSHQIQLPEDNEDNPQIKLLAETLIAHQSPSSNQQHNSFQCTETIPSSFTQQKHDTNSWGSFESFYLCKYLATLCTSSWHKLDNRMRPGVNAG